MTDFRYEDIAKMIDHSLLIPTTTQDELEAGCQLALTFDVASVCILPYYLARCTEILAGSTVMPSTTIGFPHGGHTTRIKVAEAEQAVADGCQELDMVVNISKVMSKDWDYVASEIKAIVDIAHQSDRKVKVIFENCYLEEVHKIKLCELCAEAGADWVKTSTGYGSGGATLEDLQLMRDHSPESMQVKAAGGVRDMETALKVRSIGVTRIGTSRTAGLLNECREMLGLEPLEAPSAPTSGY